MACRPFPPRFSYTRDGEELLQELGRMHHLLHSLEGRRRPSTSPCSQPQAPPQIVKEPVVLEMEAPSFVLVDTLMLKTLVIYMADL